MGRPTLYNRKRADAIVNGIMAGLTKRDAASAAGISVDTLTNWERTKPDFSARMEDARARRTRGWLSALTRRAMEGDVKAIEALLDRCAGPEYRRKQYVEVSGPEGAAISHNITLTDEEYRTAERIAQRRGIPIEQVIAGTKEVLAVTGGRDGFN